MIESSHPELSAPPGWVTVDFATTGTPSSFLSGEPHADRLCVRYFTNEAGTAFQARAWFGEGAEGPPGHAHGGAVAAVLDESMGSASWCFGHPAVAASLSVDFLEMVPLGTVGTVEAWVERVEGRKIWLACRLSTAEGAVLATGRALFVELEPQSFGRISEEMRRASERRARRGLGPSEGAGP